MPNNPNDQAAAQDVSGLVERLRAWKFAPGTLIYEDIQEAADRLAALSTEPARSQDRDREAVADIIAAKVSAPVLKDGDWKKAHRLDQLAAADAILSLIAVPGVISKRDAMKEALRRWHRDSCYPDALDAELEIGLDAVIAAAAGRSDG